MKIGIITFHRAYNIGANLQAYALQKFIEDNICNAELIDYYPNNEVPQRQSLVRKLLHLCNVLIHYKEMHAETKRERKFETFWREYYNLSATSYYGDKDFILADKSYDIYISGSDQILNTTLSGNSESYYLKSISGKKISYASSFGRESISDVEHRLIKSELKSFSALSVREKTAADIIEEDIKIRPELVLDPVFLLTAEEWRRLAVLPKIDSYIFAYAMEDTPQIRAAVEEAKELWELPVVLVAGSRSARQLPGSLDLECGPREFLGYISNASYVITNSFHGTALSIIFGKEFVAVAHASRNIRLKNITNMIGAETLMVNENCDKPIQECIIHGDIAYSKLQANIGKSKSYLLENITA